MTDLEKLIRKSYNRKHKFHLPYTNALCDVIFLYEKNYCEDGCKRLDKKHYKFCKKLNKIFRKK